jgi:hypothetical protein
MQCTSVVLSDHTASRVCLGLDTWRNNDTLLKWKENGNVQICYWTKNSDHRTLLCKMDRKLQDNTRMSPAPLSVHVSEIETVHHNIMSDFESSLN